jgi:hypothetical protein
MLPLEIIGLDGRRHSDSALIDTGADSSAFPLFWMKLLGIRKKDCRKQDFTSAGGTADQWNFRDGLTAIILGQQVQLVANFVDTPIALLGREDFLVRFRVRFDQSRQRFTISCN